MNEEETERKRTSTTVKIALSPTPTMNTSRNTRCRLLWRFVSKTESRMRPHPPMNAPRIASAENTRSRRRMLWISLHTPLHIHQFYNSARVECG